MTRALSHQPDATCRIGPESAEGMTGHLRCTPVETSPEASRQGRFLLKQDGAARWL